ncbi:MAG TPA: winged helix-turn-helix domain-containing protein [Thermoanaerobaculia bacterium]|nr:winged helix-turn-helix domain-containing protein [Thermoanaerobaculia bacterium]
MSDGGRFRLAGCEVQPDLNRVVRDGEALAVEPKIMSALVLLARAGGEVVTRERLLEQVWEGAWVGDDVVTRAIGELRRLFDDDSRSPRVIETIRKRGYRLVAAVEELDRASEAEPAAPRPQPDTDSSRSRVVVATSRVTLRVGSGRLVPAALGALLVLGLLTLGLALRSEVGGAAVDTGDSRATVRVYPLSGSLADERDPAVSPDGTRIAFAAVSPDEAAPADAARSRLVVKLLRGEARHELTDGSAADRHPVWSPDGTELVFQRIDDDGCWLATVAATGGLVRRLVPCDVHAPARMAYSPDGRFLAITRLVDAPPRRWALYLLDLGSLQLERITDPRPPYLGDLEPAFSPDGVSVAFARVLPGGAADLWRVDLVSRIEQRLTADYRAVEGQTFGADGSSVVFASDRGGSFALWSVPTVGGEPRWLTGTGSKIKHPSHARDAPVLAFEDWRFEIALWRVPLDPPGDVAGSTDLEAPPGEIVARSSGWDFAPATSPDGGQLLFTSSRSGGHELWRVAAGGGRPEQITRHGGQVLSPARWSPDGRRVVYAAFHLGEPDLYVLELGAAVPRRLTHDAAVEILPSWSIDGGAVYYSAERDGRWQVHRLSLDGGVAEVVAEGISARQAPDGSLLVVRPERPGLWRHPPAGGEPLALVPDLEPRRWGSWDVGREGVFHIVEDHSDPRQSALAFRPFDEGRSPRLLARLGELARPEIAVTPDGSAIYVARVDRAEVQLMVAENLGAP